MALQNNTKKWLRKVLVDKAAYDEVVANLQNVDNNSFTTLSVTTLTTTAVTASAAAATTTIKANTASAFVFSDATTSVLSIDTRNTVKNTAAVAIIPSPVTIASESAAITSAALSVPARTVTLTGTTTTTSLLGASAHFGAVTVTDASTCTLTTLSAIHITANAAAGGMLTITNSRMISTSVSDCYLTNAGVWTDTASSAAIKNDIRDATDEEIDDVIAAIKPKAWKYKEEITGPDHGRTRIGIVAQELPECFRIPGQDSAGGMSGTLMGSVLLACVSRLHNRVKELEAAQRN
jgi:hypothetical protein